MVEIEAVCPDCGTVTVPADRWRMVVYPQRPESSFCSFRCACTKQVMLPANPRVIAALWYIVPSSMEHIPVEALEDHSGSPLTEDDLVEFMHELSQLP